MFSNVFLEKQLARGFLKAALRSGQVRLATPQNEYEERQIREFTKQLNQSRADRRALYYGLMFDHLFLNEISWGGNHLFESAFEEDDDLRSRPIIEYSSPELNSFVAISDVIRQSVRLFDTAATDKVNLFAMCEPLIWQSWKRAGKERITRSSLRDVLDFMVLRPDLAKGIHDCKGFDTRSLKCWRSDLEPLGRKYVLDDDAVHFFLSTISVTWTKGLTAVSSLWEAQALNAAFPVSGLTFANGRSLLNRGQLEALKDESLIAGVRLFLNEIQHFPVIESLDDVLRLRSNKEFSRFQSTLHQWLTAITCGDISGEVTIRAELRKSNEALRRTITCEVIGRYFVYLALPLVVLDAITFPIFSASLSVAGFGVQAYADWQRRKHKWLMIGQSRT